MRADYCQTNHTKAWNAFFKGFLCTRGLHILSINNNQIGKEMASLRTSMLHLENLKHLDIGNCGCQDSDILREMFETLLSNHEAEFVNIGGNQIDGMYAELLKDAPIILVT